MSQISDNELVTANLAKSPTHLLKIFLFLVFMIFGSAKDYLESQTYHLKRQFRQVKQPKKLAGKQ